MVGILNQSIDLEGELTMFNSMIDNCNPNVIGPSTVKAFILIPIVQYSLEILGFAVVALWAIIVKRSNGVANIFMVTMTLSAIIQLAYYFTWNLRFVSALSWFYSC